VGLRRHYDIIVLTTIKLTREKNQLGADKEISNVQGVASAETVLHKDDIMVLYGHNKNIKKLLKDQNKY
jgi:trk system potassium uptake protein TrkA